MDFVCFIISIFVSSRSLQLFARFSRDSYRSEIMLRVLMLDARFASKQASVRTALSGDGTAAVPLGDLLLAPLRILPRYVQLLRGMLDATPAADWRERRRLVSAVELVEPRMIELAAGNLSKKNNFG